MMLLAIIIPAYEPNLILLQLLEELNSLYKQQEISVKYIVIDDGSTSKISKETFKKISDIPHSVIITHQENEGTGAALKTGIKK